MKNHLDRTGRLAALRIIAIYGVFAALWIYFSDTALGLLVQDRSILVHISVFKGFFFIIVTAVLLYQLIVRYIRKTREVEKDLHVSRNLINSLMEGTTDAIFVKDLSGRYLLINSAAENLVGKSAADVIGSDDTALFSPGEAGAIMTGDRKVMDAGKVMTFEDNLTTADGVYRTFLATKGPIFDERGELAGLFGISHDITERFLAETALQESEKRYRSLFENMQNSFVHCRMIFQDGVPVDYEYITVNPAFERITGLKDVAGRKISEVIPGYCRDNPESLEIFGRVARTGKPERWEHYLEALDTWYSFVIYSPAGGEFVAVCDDITKRKLAEEVREATIGLLRVCNESGSKRELMQELTGFFHRLTGCEAVGVRLKEGVDFPYYETRGFPEEFLLLENSLCAYDQKGELIRDSTGHPVYDCMCGNVLSGRFDPAKPFFTPHGSFWSSCTSDLLATTTDEDRQAKTRNRCNSAGFESVALVPLRTRGETFGLFQFNDRRTGRFAAEKIALYEEMVAYVAIALAKLKAEEALSESSQFSGQIISSAEEGIIVYGRDLCYQVWNPYMERLTGKKAEEVIGRHPLECFPFLQELGIIENIQKALAGQTLAAIEFPMQSTSTGLIL